MENLSVKWFYDEAEEETAPFLKGRCHGLSTSKQRDVAYGSSAKGRTITKKYIRAGKN